VVGMVAMALVCARFSAGEAAAAAAEEARRSRAGETRLVEGLCADGEGNVAGAARLATYRVCVCVPCRPKECAFALHKARPIRHKKQTPTAHSPALLLQVSWRC
jgi:hypothetical protein